MNTTTRRRGSAVRKAGWLAVASMLALAALAPGASPALAGSFNGAIWTSLSTGATVNANIYDAKSDVYLNGGPQNCGNSNGLPNGDYYFQVTDPSGATLLSTDAIKFRQVKVENNVISGVSGFGDHNVGSTNCVGGLPVQLMPYNNTPNSGGEYSVDLAPVAAVAACTGFSADSTSFNFLDCAGVPSKNDNYKVRLQAPAIAIQKVADPTSVPAGGANVNYTYTVTNPGNVALSNVTVSDDKCDSPVYASGDTNANDLLDLTETWTFTCSTLITVDTTNTAIAHGWWDGAEVTAQAQATVTVLPPTAPPTAAPTATPTVAPTATPTVAPTATPTVAPSFSQAVLAETGTPSVTLPPSDMSSNGPTGSDSWRIALLAIAALLASALVMTPATSRSRR